MHRLLFKMPTEGNSAPGRFTLNSLSPNHMDKYNGTSVSSSTISSLDLHNVNSSMYDDYIRHLINSKYSNHNNNNNTNDNFFYQHVFNISLVLIFLLQVLIVWTFILRRKRRQAQDAGDLHNMELGDMPDLVVIIPPQQPNVHLNLQPGQQTRPAPAG